MDMTPQFVMSLQENFTSYVGTFKRYAQEIRSLFIDRAKWAQDAKRYEDMSSFMKSAVERFGELTMMESQLFSTAYRNVINAKRKARATIREMEIMEIDEKKKQVAKKYREEIEKELLDVGSEVLTLLERLLIKTSTDEDKVMYQRMKGDYYRYLAEVAIGDQKNNSDAHESQKAYEEALRVSKNSMRASHPLHLAVCINYSLLYSEILNSPDEAFQLTKQAYCEAMADIDPDDTESDNDRSSIQVLKHNFTVIMQRLIMAAEAPIPDPQAMMDTSDEHRDLSLPSVSMAALDISAAESKLVVEEDYQKMVSQMNKLEMSSDQDLVIHASFNNPNTAVSGSIPSEPQVAGDEADPDTQEPNTSLVGGESVAGGPLDFLRGQPQFEEIRQVLQQNPHLLDSVLQQIGQDDPQLLQLITENQGEFMTLINEHFVSMITPQDTEAIERIKSLGFPEYLVVQAYFAWDKNENRTAKFLLSLDFED